MLKTPPYRYFPFSKLTVFFAIFIVLSSSFMRQLMNLAKANIGETGFEWLVALILVGSGSIFLIIVIKNGFFKQRSRVLPVLVAIAITAIGSLLIWRIEIVEERIHLLEFAVLGWLSLKDASKLNNFLKGLSLALGFTLSIGVLDEGFQAILPYRYFQTWDILLNSLGGLWGITLFLVLRGTK